MKELPPMQPADPAAMISQARAATDLLKTLSNETRLLILCLLSGGEMSVSQLEEKLKIPQASLSQQLARLRSEKLVDTRREGRMIYYFVADKRAAQVVGTLYDLYCRV